MTVDCNDLPEIHWWTSKKRILVADDGCRWIPHYMVYPPRLRGGIFRSSRLWMWAPLPEREDDD